MAGSDPPFHMPGYRWDGEKKRFFKEAPGPVPDAPIASSAVAESAGTESANQATPIRLPALSIAALSSSSAFHSSRVDPVSLRSLGGRFRSQGIDFDRHATRSAYSQLALFQARRLHGASVRFIQQTEDRSRTMLVLLDDTSIVRLSPVHGLMEQIARRRVWQTNVLGFHYEPTRLVWTLYESDGGKTDLGAFLLPEPIDQRLLPLDPSPDVSVPNLADVGESYTTHLRGIRACAAHTFESDSSQHNIRFHMALCHDQTVRIVKCGLVQEHFSPVGPEKSPRWSSDTTAVAFSPDGEHVYVGLRSGKVMAYHWRQPDGAFDHIKVQGAGAVTNISVTGTAILIVWTSGEVRLIDASTYDVMRSYNGHRNTYLFDLGFALEPKLKLMALAGIDNKVRVWSLDESSPLESSETHLLPTVRARTRSGNALPAWASFDDLDHAKQGSVLGNIQFPGPVKCLHWSPRDEAQDRPETAAQDQASPSPWSDLYVACGEWIYHCRWP